MKHKRYKPLIDKYFLLIWIPVAILLIIGTIITFLEPLAFIIMIAVNLFTWYFMLSSLSGYLELRDESIYIKFGFIIKREIRYDKIRSVIKERKVMSTSPLSLKNALDHIVIKYNKFDEVVVSVMGNDDLLIELEERKIEISL